MEKLSATLNGALVSQLLLVGYELELFKELNSPITSKGLYHFLLLYQYSRFLPMAYRFNI